MVPHIFLLAATLYLLNPFPDQATAIQQQEQTGANIQAIAQMLQVFNGNDSNQLEANHFKVVKLDGDHILVGAR